MTRPRRPASAYAKAVAAGVGAVATALATSLPDSSVGKWAAAVLAVLVAVGLTERTRNTQVVTTGPTEGPVVLAPVVSGAGEVIGNLTADTGAAVGGIVAGTTGRVGRLLDATLGRLLPKG